MNTLAIPLGLLLWQPPTDAPVPDNTVAVTAPESSPEPATALFTPGGAWTFGSFVDVAYLFNSNVPQNHVYRGTVTTPRTGEFTINLASAYLFHEPTQEAPFRFELAGQFGAGTDALYASEPRPGAPDDVGAGAEVWKHLAAANAGVLVRKTKTEIGAGLFSSPIGIGGYWSRFNWNYSPSWESNAAPFYLAGARILQSLPAGFGLEAWVINGWQTIADANAAPSYLAGLTWAGQGFSVAQYVYFGPDQADISPASWRVHSDTFVMYERPRFGVGVVWDYGQERIDPPMEPSRINRWTGGGLFVHGLAVDREHVELDLALRPDAWYEDGDSIYGVSQWLISGTATVSLRLFDAIMVRAEYRYDRSTAEDGFFFRGEAIAPGDDGLAQDQHTVFLNLTGYFERNFGINWPAKASKDGS